LSKGKDKFSIVVLFEKGHAISDSILHNQNAHAARSLIS